MRASVLLAFLCAATAHATVQFQVRKAIGQFYSVELSSAATRFAQEIVLERVAPHAVVRPPPIGPLSIGSRLRALTGQIYEIPDRHRLFFPAQDAAGVVRLFEVDLLSRAVRQIRPPSGSPAPRGVRMLADPQATKLYVQWFSGMAPVSDIYDGETLAWLGATGEFLPDERAAGFVSRAGTLWTLDEAGRAVLVDTGSDRALATYDPRRWFGPRHSVVADAWRDLLLVRSDAGHDRFQVVDVVSGELGPPIDLTAYAPVQPRLALDGQVLVLIDLERRPPRRGYWQEAAIATGGIALYHLRSGQFYQRIRLGVAERLPVRAVGTYDGPAAPGRLWIYLAGEQRRVDLNLPSCTSRSPAGTNVKAAIHATLDVSLDPEDSAPIYRYRLRADPASPAPVGGLAIRVGTAIEGVEGPPGWGVDRIDRRRWVRWTNGLGPSLEDVGPGEASGTFTLLASRDTRPGIAEYRAQAAIGLPRGCESDSRFLENSQRGYTMAPETVERGDLRAAAERLERLVDRACEIGWVDASGCSQLRLRLPPLLASTTTPSDVDALAATLATVGLNDTAAIVLEYAAQAVREALGQ